MVNLSYGFGMGIGFILGITTGLLGLGALGYVGYKIWDLYITLKMYKSEKEYKNGEYAM